MMMITIVLTIVNDMIWWQSYIYIYIYQLLYIVFTYAYILYIYVVYTACTNMYQLYMIYRLCIGQSVFFLCRVATCFPLILGSCWFWGSVKLCRLPRLNNLYIIYMGSVIGMLFRIYSFNIVYTFWDIPNTLLAPFMLPFFETLLGVFHLVQWLFSPLCAICVHSGNLT